MPDTTAALKHISDARSADPLAPVTVLAPSHTAALQMRRRLAHIAPFAAVRFETLPRIAELLGAGPLARQQRRPLARPIGDYVAELVARQSRGALEGIADLPGYARALRQIFRRLRRGGIRDGSEVPGPHPGHLGEVLRLYRLYRERTAGFYDEEDLLDAAADALASGSAGAFEDMGALYVVPPGPLTASGQRLLDELRRSAPACTEVDDPEPAAEPRFLLAPDPASEAREVVREVVRALETGAAIDEIAVFHGAGGDYSRLLRESFAQADVPCVPAPGIPLSESRAGRGVLLLTAIMEDAYARTAVMDFLAVAPVREWLPTSDGPVRSMTALWDRISREAGVAHSLTQWTARLRSYITDREADAHSRRQDDDQARADAAAFHGEAAAQMLSVIEELARRLEPLRERQSAGPFIDRFKSILEDYFVPNAEGMENVLGEIEQLRTVEAVDGEFSLSTLADSLEANLEAATYRPEGAGLGEGILVADYRQAGGLLFSRVVLCGAFEGAMPAGPGGDTLLDDNVWRRLREDFPHIEDKETRIRRSEEAALRAMAAAGQGNLLWSCPRFQPGGAREYYPSHFMVDAVSATLGTDGQRVTATSLRDGRPKSDVIRHAPSPMTGALLGPPLDAAEAAMRSAVRMWQAGQRMPNGHPRERAVSMLNARRSHEFTEWDGNLSALRDDAWLKLQRAVSPTSLERYATCGFRYLCGSLLRLNTVEEPQEREVMAPVERGSLIHRVLDRFFREQKERGRPAQNEAWNDSDERALMAIFEEELEAAAERGLTGLEVYGEHDARTMRADLRTFLQEDTEFRRRTGAVPSEFERAVPETEIAGITLRGFVDRIDRTPDGKEAWIIDYKTGSSYDFRAILKDPLAGGAKLQLPTYLAAAGDAETAQALYWFITSRGEFEQVPYEPTPENQERFHRTIAAILDGVRSGAFPPVPGEDDEYKRSFDNCVYCDFDRICSRRRDYEFAAKAGHSDVGPWRNVGRTASPEAEA